MGQVVLNGPVIDADTQNAVLRDAVIHSPEARANDPSNYYTIEVGVRSGSNTSWVGTWDQSTQSLDAATPTSILDDGRKGMRLSAGYAIVVRITSTGCPSTLKGTRLGFTLALVGGRSGVARPLVSAGAAIAEPNSRVAIAALERQINTGGLSEWNEAVDLVDPVEQVDVGAFQGRLQRDSSTQISLQRYTGNWVEVDGEPLAITSTGLTRTTSDGILSSSGNVTSTAPSSSTLYYVYIGSVTGLPQIRLCATAPSVVNGVYYLGTDSITRTWRFCGWVRLDGSTHFVDTTTDRLVVNYYNREWKELFLRPDYTDDNAATTYTETSTTWTAANGGTGATGSYIANGQDGIHVTAFAMVSNSGANVSRIGIGDNSGTNCATGAIVTGTTAQTCACSYSTTPASGYRTLVLLTSVSAGTATYRADDARNGSATDPVMTGLYTKIPV